MHSGPSSRSRGEFPPGIAPWLRLAVLLLPAFLLIGGTARTDGQAQKVLWLGGVVQVLIVSLLMLSRRLWNHSIGSSALLVYMIAMGWLWMGDAIQSDWYSHFAQSVLLVVPLLFFAVQTLTDSGALTSRRARLLAHRLAERKDWPLELADCRTLPDVKALREAMSVDASPALALLGHPRVQVRVAALAALEFRKHWRGGQAAMVLKLAQSAREPVVRACAISALANVDDRAVVEQLAEFLHDSAADVRRAASEALLWDTEYRWAWIRHGVRQALADPLLQGDGAMRFDGIVLQTEAINDLTAWSTEKGTLGVRAALTLASHYGRMMNEQPDKGLIRHLKQQLASLQAAPTLRIELAQLLKNTGELDRALLEGMVDGSSPGPLRLIAADVLLADNKSAGFPHPRALAALRDIARLPNREMALGAADVVQRRLGIDMGLALGQPLPPLHSRLAADVTRRLMSWVAQEDSRATQGPAALPPDEDDGFGELPTRRPDHGSGVFGLGPAAR